MKLLPKTSLQTFLLILLTVCAGILLYRNSKPWERKFTIQPKWAVEYLTFSPDQKNLIAVTANDEIVHWDVRTGETIKKSFLTKHRKRRPRRAYSGTICAFPISKELHLGTPKSSKLKRKFKTKVSIKNGGISLAKLVPYFEKKLGLKFEFYSGLQTKKAIEAKLQFKDLTGEFSFIWESIVDELNLVWFEENEILQVTSWSESSKDKRFHKLSKIQIWNLNSGKPISALDGTQSGTGDISFSNNGRFIASIDIRGVIQCWDLKLKIPIGNIQTKILGIKHVDVTNDGKLLLAKTGRRWSLWNIRNNQILAEGKSNTPLNQSLAPNGSSFAVWSKDLGLRIWHAPFDHFQEPILPIKDIAPDFDYTKHLTYSADSQYLFIRTNSGLCHMLDLKNSNTPYPLSVSEYCPNNPFIPSGQHYLIPNEYVQWQLFSKDINVNEVTFQNLDDSNILSPNSNQRPTILNFSESLDGNLLALEEPSGIVSLWKKNREAHWSGFFSLPEFWIFPLLLLLLIRALWLDWKVLLFTVKNRNKDYSKSKIPIRPILSPQAILFGLVLVGGAKGIWQEPDAWTLASQHSAYEEEINGLKFTKEKKHLQVSYKNGNKADYCIHTGKFLGASDNSNFQILEETNSYGMINNYYVKNEKKYPNFKACPPTIFEKLQCPITADFQDEELRHVLYLIRDVAGVPIELKDPHQILKKRPITIRFKEASALYILNNVTKLVFADWIYQDGKLLVFNEKEIKSLKDEKKSFTAVVKRKKDDRTILRIPELPEPARYVGVSLNEQNCAVSTYRGEYFCLWNAKSKTKKIISGSQFQNVRFSYRSIARIFVTNSGDKVGIMLINGLHQWKPTTGEITKIGKVSLRSYPPLVFSPTGDRALISCEKNIWLWNCNNWSRMAVLGDSYPNEARFNFSQDGNLLFKESYGTPRIYDLKTGLLKSNLKVKKPEIPIGGGANPFQSMRAPDDSLPIFSSDGRLAAFSVDNNLVQVWRKNRPEEWWGWYVRPAFWLTVVGAFVFLREICFNIRDQWKSDQIINHR